MAVSGGSDSVAGLLLLEKEIRKGQYSFSLHVGHVQHDLRDQGPQQDRFFVRKLCRELDVPFHSREVAVSDRLRKNSHSPEEVARTLRYRALGEIAEEQNISAVLTAHHKDDQIETLLMRLKRGTGVFGLTGIPARREMNLPRRNSSVTVLRPFLNLRSEQLKQYLMSKDQTWREDPSNRNLKRTRNWIRHCLIPFLETKGGTNWQDQLLSIQKKARKIRRRTRRKWKQKRNHIFRTSPKSLPEHHLFLNRSETVELSPIFYWHLLRAIDRHLNGSSKYVSETDLNRLSSCLKRNQTGTSISLSGGLKLTLEHRGIHIRPEDSHHESIPSSSILLPGGTQSWGHLNVTSHFIASDQIEALVDDLRNDRWDEIVDEDSITSPLSIGPRTAGETIQPLGMDGRKKIKSIMIDQKIPRSQRSRWPIIRDRKGAIWIPGLKMADRVKISGETRSGLRIRVTGNSEHPSFLVDDQSKHP